MHLYKTSPVNITKQRAYKRVYISSVYSQFSDRVGLPLHNILSPGQSRSVNEEY